MNEGKKSSESVNTAVLGIVLMGVGIVFYLLNILDVDYGRFGWPFFIIIPGTVLFISAWAADESMGQALAITGGIITTAGTILFYQNLTNHWTSWAYAWALVAPGSIGLAQFIFGSLRKQTKMIKEGRQLLLIGLAIFFGGFVSLNLSLASVALVWADSAGRFSLSHSVWFFWFAAYLLERNRKIRKKWNLRVESPYRLTDDFPHTKMLQRNPG